MNFTGSGWPLNRFATDDVQSGNDADFRIVKNDSANAALENPDLVFPDLASRATGTSARGSEIFRGRIRMVAGGEPHRLSGRRYFYSRFDIRGRSPLLRPARVRTATVYGRPTANP